jgi:hypothetical protein
MECLAPGNTFDSFAIHCFFLWLGIQFLNPGGGGRNNLHALRSHHPGKPSGFNVRRILGNGDLWVTEYTITYQGRLAYTASIMEFRNGKVVHETQYFADPFEAPAWRRQWVQQIAPSQL